jgi:hypothetical protein
MVLDRTLADAEVGRNILAGMAGKHQLHDLALARGQIGEARRCRVPLIRKLGQISGVFQGALDAGEQSSRRIGFSMKSAAPAFMASTAIGRSPWPVIMMAGSRFPSL